MRAHQPGSTPIDIPETVPNPAYTPAPAPERAPTKVPEKVPEKVISGIAALAVVAAAYYWTKVSRVTLFWAAFILTRPLGATVGDFLDKPVNHGGLALSRPIASAVIAAFIIGCLLILPQRAGSHPKVAETVA